MPRANGTLHTKKQQRQAKHIEASYAKQGMPAKRRKAIAWATVNKQDQETTTAVKKKPARTGKAASSPAMASTKAGTSTKAGQTKPRRTRQPALRQLDDRQLDDRQADPKQHGPQDHDGDHHEDASMSDSFHHQGRGSSFHFSVI